MTATKLRNLLNKIIKAGYGRKHVVRSDAEWGHRRLTGSYRVNVCDERSFFGDPTDLTGKLVVVLE